MPVVVNYPPPSSVVVNEVTGAVTVVAAGPRGVQGVQGPAATVAVGTVATGAPGSDATVTNSGTSGAAVLDFAIPRGDVGQQGIQGEQGIQGVPGNAATVTVGSTTTGAPGSSAAVTNSGTSSAAVFDFAIPEGIQGEQGIQGVPGNAATIAAGTTTTGAAGSSASVTNSGSSSAAVFDFTIPQGIQGVQGIQGIQGVQGIQGEPGVVTATSPATYDAPTQTVGVDQTAITLAQSQVTGLETDLTGKASTTATLTTASFTNVAGSIAGLPNTFFISPGANRSHPASSLQLWPFVVTDTITVTHYLVDVRSNTSVASETLKAGIYNWSADFTVGSLVIEFPTLTVPTGNGLYVTALASPLDLQAGRYAVAWNVSANTFGIRAPQVAVGLTRIDLSNIAIARFQSGANGAAPIANALPDPAPSSVIAISTDAGNWGPSVLLVWSYK
jgi:hypothetical protein